MNIVFTLLLVAIASDRSKAQSADAVCVTTPIQGCIKYNPSDAGECLQCESGKFPNSDKDGCDTCTNVLDFCDTCDVNEAGETYCVKCTDNDKKPNPAGSNCFTCQVEDCVKCARNNVCEDCVEGKYPYPTSAAGDTCGDCITASRSDNCDTCVVITGVTICDICPDNMALDESYDCVECTGINCRTCDSSQSFAKCINCHQDKFLNSAKECLACEIDNCTTCSDDASTCTSCANGYHGDTTDMCTACMENCADCADGTTCTTCDDGYYKNDGNTCTVCGDTCATCTDENACKACAAGHFGGPTCTACSQNCTVCTAADMCTSCDDGYYVDDNNACTACSTIDDCVECDDASTCTKCGEGKFVDNNDACGDCGDVVTDCLQCEKSVTGYAVCTSCDSNKYPKPGVDAHTTCEASCPDVIPSCSVCKVEEGVTVCTACNNDLIPSADGTCCTVCAAAIPECSTCAEGAIMATCTACANGKFVSNDSKECQTCEESITDCTTCEADSDGKATCSACGNGKQKSDDSKACVICGIDDCKACSANGVCAECEGDKVPSSDKDECIDPPTVTDPSIDAGEDQNGTSPVSFSFLTLLCASMMALLPIV